MIMIKKPDAPNSFLLVIINQAALIIEVNRMVRVKWDIEELVALADIYIHSKGKTQNEIKDELESLSIGLNHRADQLGIIHDNKYRNMNGMNMTHQNIIFVMTNGQQGLSSANKLMYEVAKMVTEKPEIFELILEQFNHKYRD